MKIFTLFVLLILFIQVLGSLDHNEKKKYSPAPSGQKGQQKGQKKGACTNAYCKDARTACAQDPDCRKQIENCGFEFFIKYSKQKREKNMFAKENAEMDFDYCMKLNKNSSQVRQCQKNMCPKVFLQEEAMLGDFLIDNNEYYDA